MITIAFNDLLLSRARKVREYLLTRHDLKDVRLTVFFVVRDAAQRLHVITQVPRVEWDAMVENNIEPIFVFVNNKGEGGDPVKIRGCTALHAFYAADVIEPIELQRNISRSLYTAEIALGCAPTSLSSVLEDVS